MVEAISQINKKKYIIDLLIIGFVSLIILLIVGLIFLVLKINVADKPLLLQVLIWSFIEYGIMGLGMTIICIFRKECFASFGLKKDKLLLTLALSTLPCLPELLKTVIQNGSIIYFPFQGVNFTKSVLASGFPINVIGMIMIVTSWGFFEGFTYAVISDRINKLLPKNSIFINWGAIICGVFCVILHIMLGHSYSGIDALCTFFVIYGMLVIYKYTGNAWGCVFIYFVYWNAIA
jgi:hypothetical protein